VRVQDALHPVEQLAGDERLVDALVLRAPFHRTTPAYTEFRSIRWTAPIPGGLPRRFLRPFSARASVRAATDSPPVAYRSNAHTTWE
jgi:hypothetical protein